MKYQSYEKYKDSGFAWLGKIPTSWDAVSLKWTSKIYAGGTPDKTKFEYWDEGTIPWLNSGEVNQFTITEPSNFITDEGYRNSSARYLEIDSLVMALAGQGKTKGMVAQTKIRTTCNQSMAAIFIKRQEPRYILWWLASQYENIRNLAGGDARDGLNLELVGSIKCPIPSISEQKYIAAFLDKKTAEIDALIAKKEELLLKLAEKRTAMITHAVTKGLNPSTLMKESGIDWLGQIPAHWEIKKLAYVASINAGYAFSSEDFQDDGVRVIRISDIDRNGNVELSAAKFLPQEYSDSLKQFLVHRNDIVMAMTGATIGKVGIYNDENPSLLNQRVCKFVPKSSLENGYLWLLLNSDFYKEHIFLTAFGGAQPNISDRQLLLCKVPSPSPQEQKKIVDFLDKKTVELDKTVHSIGNAIDKLKEYRSALITNAVTGKIKVT